MIDIHKVLKNPTAFDTALAHRGEEAQSKTLIELDEARKRALTEVETTRAKHKLASQEAHQAKKEGNLSEFDRLRLQTAQSKERISDLEQSAKAASANLREIVESIPNLPLESVPIGKDASDNVVQKEFGTIRPRDYPAKEHFELGQDLGLMDFTAAAKISGSRFVVLKGVLARLHQALGRFMLDRHTEQNDYEQIWVPQLVNPKALYGTGQLPKFRDDLYQTTQDHWLIPTAEVPLTNLVAEEILDAKSLPHRYVAWTSCFRSEAGAAGQDTHGMLRQHQFEKVELVSITRPEDSEEEFSRMVQSAEGILEDLEIPYRTIELCTGDLGFAAAKTFDLEVWLPGQNEYREISSCSNCLDFQARRMNARYRPKSQEKPVFVHTLNGSGTAIGRALIAVLENGQNQDGSIDLPNVLQPYLGYTNQILADGTLHKP